MRLRTITAVVVIPALLGILAMSAVAEPGSNSPAKSAGKPRLKRGARPKEPKLTERNEIAQQARRIARWLREHPDQAERIIRSHQRVRKAQPRPAAPRRMEQRRATARVAEGMTVGRRRGQGIGPAKWQAQKDRRDQPGPQSPRTTGRRPGAWGMGMGRAARGRAFGRRPGCPMPQCGCGNCGPGGQTWARRRSGRPGGWMPGPGHGRSPRGAMQPERMLRRQRPMPWMQPGPGRRGPTAGQRPAQAPREAARRPQPQPAQVERLLKRQAAEFRTLAERLERQGRKLGERIEQLELRMRELQRGRRQPDRRRPMGERSRRGRPEQ